MYFIISIDTEEDNWDNFKEEATLKNIPKIPVVQAIFDKHQVRPTYLITYPVATDKASQKILKPILDSKRCEIGTHLHPWNTPPNEEKLNDKNRMLNNLGCDLQLKKLKTLHKTILDNFGVQSKSFRAGRYALNQDLAQNLVDMNYAVESSITPFLNWTSIYGPDFSKHNRLNPYIFYPDKIDQPNERGSLTEVPLSGGFLQNNFNFAQFLFEKIINSPFKHLKLIGLLSKLRLLNKVRLTPEGYSILEMSNLVNKMVRNDISFFNLSFHSNSLLPGCTPFVKTKGELVIFLEKIEKIVMYFKKLQFKSITLSEVPAIQASIQSPN